MSRCYNIVICSTPKEDRAMPLKYEGDYSHIYIQSPDASREGRVQTLFPDIAYSPMPTDRLSQIRFRLVRVGGRLWIHYDRESISNPIYSVTSSPSYRSTTSQACPESLLLNQYLRISTDEEHPSTVPRGQISKMENKTQGAARLARDLLQRNGAYTLKATSWNTAFDRWFVAISNRRQL